MVVRFVGAHQWILLGASLLALHGIVGVLAHVERGESCVTPAGLPGRCGKIRDCRPLADIVEKKTRTEEETNVLRQSFCGIVQQKPLVCCPEQAPVPPNPTSILPVSPNCGLQVTDRLVGGNKTGLEEFPWVALIEYAKNDSERVLEYGFHCGGSIINERYVLTAAHCVTGLPRGWRVHQVRLGEWDLSKDRDCDEVDPESCNAPPVNMGIADIVIHSRYDTRDASKANDIALIRLARDLQYSDTIRAICLPVEESMRHMNHEGTVAHAAGWGKTEHAQQSDIKLKVGLTINSLQQCAPAFVRSGIILKRTHLCAGGERGKDTCTGDSGGPLMRMLGGAWHLLGIVSYGSSRCGASGVSGVYVNVAEYIDWIQENIQ